uniref:RGS domain-containing protein n=1 Tax=Glossina brevipalpis TaxID=37001 RepID=A0A1A9WJ25_9MUSC
MVKHSMQSLSSHNNTTPSPPPSPSTMLNAKKSKINNTNIILHHVNHNHNNNIIQKMCIKSPKSSSFNKIIERFVQSIIQINDSANFDNSFEIKGIQGCTSTTSNRLEENRCAITKNQTELMRFAREFEICQINNDTSNQSTPKTSPYLCRKAKALYENLFNKTTSSRESSPKPANNIKRCAIVCDNDDDDDDDSNDMDPLAFHRTYSERSSSRSTKVLQLFTNKKITLNKSNCNENFTNQTSPVLMRSHKGNDNFINCSDIEEYIEYHQDDDENDLNDNNNCLDTTYELLPPLVPTFKVTPPKYTSSRTSSQSATAELAQFLRSSFHAKRANITRLRRSLSDTNSFQNVDVVNIKQLKTPPSPIPCLAAKKQILVNITNYRNRENTATHHCSLNSNTSPFRRGWGPSLLRLSSPSKDTLQHKSHSTTLVHRAASMTTTTANDVYNTKNLLDVNKSEYHKQDDNNSLPSSRRVGSVASWAIAFEQLLEHPAGLKAFAEFLKLEYSAENIYFWISCEHYRNVENESERVEQAKNIFYKHLANGSSEPVNVDSQARNLSEVALNSAQRDIFVPAQKQIFNLMKFDSYPRFIRSNLYRSCLQAEENGEPLPLNGDNLDDLFKTSSLSSNSSKLKKSASNAEDRRRKSLLPWHRKTRSKSRERVDDMNQRSTESISTNLTNVGNNTLFVPPSKIPLIAGSSIRHSAVNDFQSSRSSVSSLDNLPILPLDTVCALCRVKFTDGATTIVQTKSGETVGQLVERLLEKRGIRYRFYDVIIKGNNKSLDLQASTQEIAGKEIEVEQRAAFKLDLPNPKVISVKSKPKKLLHEVVKPILSKYNYEIETVEVLRRDTQEKIDLMQPVTAVDGQRLQIIPLPTIKSESSNYLNDEITKKLSTTNQMKNITYPATIISQQAANVVASRKGINILTKFTNPLPQSNIKEITNKIFKDVMQKNQQETANSTQAADQISLKSDGCNSNSSSVFDLACGKPNSTSSLPLKAKRTSTSSQHSTDLSQTNIKKPIIAKMKAGVKLQVTERVNENQEHTLESPKKEHQLPRAEVQQKSNDLNIEQPKSDKDLSAQLRQVRANLLTITKNNLPASTANSDDSLKTMEKPQPVPRLSVTNNKVKSTTISLNVKGTITENSRQLTDNIEDPNAINRDPPPLPPKPKVLPTKPPNWGVNIVNMTKTTSPTTIIPN